MAAKKLGCLTTGGLISIAVSALALLVTFLLSGSLMFSPGTLNADSSGAIIGGILSHAELGQECQYCHPSPWDTFDQSDLCLECHQDIKTDLVDTKSLHGAARTIQKTDDCRACHTEHLGAKADLTEYSGDNFPHQLMDFSIIAHSELDWDRDISCIDCHPANFLEVEESVCLDCHTDLDNETTDTHTNNYGYDCLSCHDGLESINSSYDHNLTDFHLLGEHQILPCSACHMGLISLKAFQEMDTACLSCHLGRDVHQNYLGESCEECHSPASWKAVNYEHTQTGFYLEGGHDNLLCSDCHLDQTYQGEDGNCITCHLDDESHQGAFGEDCTVCHSTTNWDIPVFDHTGPYSDLCFTCHQNESPGNHYQAQCSACHSVNAWLPASFNHAAINTSNCQSCHQKESPAKHYPAQCSACHSVNAWRPATFSHSVINTSNCQSCHLSERPNNHFSGQCSICHSRNKWKPAFVSHTFPTNHKKANNNCNLCHPGGNYTTYNCYQCHEHNSSEVKKEHKGVSNLNNCVRCHWDGKEHDDDDDD